MIVNETMSLLVAFGRLVLIATLIQQVLAPVQSSSPLSIIKRKHKLSMFHGSVTFLNIELMYMSLLNIFVQLLLF